MFVCKFKITSKSVSNFKRNIFNFPLRINNWSQSQFANRSINKLLLKQMSTSSNSTNSTTIPFDVSVRNQCLNGDSCSKQNDAHFQTFLHPPTHPLQQNNFTEIVNNYTDEQWQRIKKDTSLFGGSQLWQEMFGGNRDAASRQTESSKPAFVCAPMHDASEHAFRMLTRQYDCDIAYTPMLHAVNFAKSRTRRAQSYSTSPDDRPLVIQFCAHGDEPQSLLLAAKHVEFSCDAVDINFGCPQSVARRGNYGSSLFIFQC
jgi:hypothetical protein